MLAASSGTQTATVRAGWRRTAVKALRVVVFMFIALAPSQPTWTHLATDGTLFPLVTNSMYQPGGVILSLLFRFRLTVSPEPLIGSATNRWFGSDWCVTAAGLISSADLIGVLV